MTSLKGALTGLTLLVAGCSSTPTFGPNIKPITQEQSQALEERNDTVLETYFTPYATLRLEHIPVVVGERKHCYAAGRNAFIGAIDSIFLGIGSGRKTVTSSPNTSIRTLLHENIHHASAIGLIDDSAFSNAWARMARDPDYSGLCEKIDKGISDRDYSFWIDAALIWRDIEREACLAERMVFDAQHVPSYMREVYSRTLLAAQE